jgi:hypothetical protein
MTLMLPCMNGWMAHMYQSLPVPAETERETCSS